MYQHDHGYYDGRHHHHRNAFDGHRAAHCDDQLPIFSTIGRGPRGTSVNATAKMLDGRKIGFIITDEDGNVLVDSGDLSAGKVEFEQTAWNKITVHVIKAEGTEDYEILLPQGPAGNHTIFTDYEAEYAGVTEYLIPKTSVHVTEFVPKIDDVVFFLAEDTEDPDAALYVMIGTITEITSTQYKVDAASYAGKGATGPQGPKGDAFTYDDFTEEQLEALTGPQGPQGIPGPKGDPGDNGHGVPTSGYKNEILVKNSNGNYDTIWKDIQDLLNAAGVPDFNFPFTQYVTNPFGSGTEQVISKWNKSGTIFQLEGLCKAYDSEHTDPSKIVSIPGSVRSGIKIGQLTYLDDEGLEKTKTFDKAYTCRNLLYFWQDRNETDLQTYNAFHAVVQLARIIVGTDGGIYVNGTDNSKTLDAHPYSIILTGIYAINWMREAA